MQTTHGRFFSVPSFIAPLVVGLSGSLAVFLLPFAEGVLHAGTTVSGKGGEAGVGWPDCFCFCCYDFLRGSRWNDGRDAVENGAGGATVEKMPARPLRARRARQRFLSFLLPTIEAFLASGGFSLLIDMLSLHSALPPPVSH